MRFARLLEKNGVHVAYGVMGYKTHCKCSLVVRREPDGLRCYAHLGTGNYNPGTAQLYTDLGVLTCDTDEQALARSGGAHGNKGADVALDALRLCDVLDAVGREGTR